MDDIEVYKYLSSIYSYREAESIWNFWKTFYHDVDIDDFLDEFDLL